MSGRAAPSAARRVLRALARIVPASERRAWLMEWEGELDVLETTAESGRPAGAGSDGGEGRNGGGRGREHASYPPAITFVLGALPHALWMRKEDWAMDGVLQDLGHALRVLRRSPGFTAAATLTLALGIGANATIFTLVNGLVLRDPSGVREPDRLVQIARSYDEAPRWDNWSWPALRMIRGEARVFERVAGYSELPLTIGAGMDAEQVSALMVTGEYFDVLGVRPVVGRLLGPQDDVVVGGHPVAVLGHELWQRRFGADPGLVGRSVQAGGRSYEVVGVAPADFRGAETLGSAPQVYLSARMHPPSMDMLPFEEWGWSWISGVGRLAEGVSYEEARTAMDVVSSRLREADPVNEGVRVLLAQGIGLSPEERAEARRLALMLSGIALLVLLLTCASVANLFVARATAREGEMGVRLALGAGRGRLARQLVTESLVLGSVAAAVALVPLTVGTRALPALIPYPVNGSLAPDARVFLSLLALGLLSGLLFGGAPSVAAARRDLAGTIRASGSCGVTGSSRARDVLVALQLTLSLGLLAGAALLGTSLLNATRADPGFEPRGLLAASMDLSGTGRYDRASAAAFGERLAREAAGLPGVVSVAVASQAPFLPGTARSTRAPADRPDDPAAEVEAYALFVSEGYVETLGIPVLRGRTLRASSAEPEPVAVINEALARRLWPGEEAVGKDLAGEPPIRVVGVVGDVQERSLRAEAAPAVYQPLTASFTQRLQLLVRAQGEPLGLAQPVRELVAMLDPGLPVLATEDVHDRMSASLGATRTVGVLVALFAGLALLLSIVGLYGLVAFSVARRVREMGIRLALGAGPSGLVGLVLGRTLGLLALGLVGGVALAVLMGLALESMLFGVGTWDPRALVLAATVLTATSLLAAWIPARRASRVDAATSLRE